MFLVYMILTVTAAITVAGWHWRPVTDFDLSILCSVVVCFLVLAPNSYHMRENGRQELTFEQGAKRVVVSFVLMQVYFWAAHWVVTR